MEYEKKYKEALELARVAAFNGHQSLMEGIFPELAESKDEKTRKRIIALVNAHGQGMYKDDMLAWLENIPYTIDHEKREGFHLGYKAGLEKQGEQKPTLRERYKNIAESEWFKKTHDGMSISDDEKVDNVNKVEPKFKVGDWIIYRDEGCTEIFKISGVTETHYICIDISDDYCRNLNINFIDNHNYHLWTIQDAKDGDVLATLDYILIFEKVLSKDYGVSHCHYGFGNTTPQFNFNKDDNWYFGKEAKVYPATKEQRDLLFQKMKEAGYEWDAENLQLTKILHVKELSDGINIDKQKLAEWSEEDEKMVANLVDYFKVDDALQYTEKQVVDWLKSLKGRAQPQPKQEWSEEDQNALEDVREAVVHYWGGDSQDILLYWLKSIKQKLKGE